MGAIQVFSRALNVSEAELFKMMENGQLVSSEVLPKVAAELKKAALEGGAFEQALKGLRVTEGQLITESQRAGNKIFKSGFSEGLSELYKTISEILKNAGPQLEKLGDIFGKVFKVIAHGLRVIEPYMKIAIDNFWTLFGAASIARILTMGATLRAAFLPITAALFAAEELASLMSDKLVGSLELSAGRQINILDATSSGITTNSDGSVSRDKSAKETSAISDLLDSYIISSNLSTLVYQGYQVGKQLLSGNENSTAATIKAGNGVTYTPSVTINNTFNNANADDMKRYQQMQIMNGLGVSK